MTKVLFTTLLLFSVHSHAEVEKLLAACAGVQVEHGSTEVDVIHAKVILEFGNTEPDLVVYKNQQQIVKLPVRVESNAGITKYKTGKFHTKEGIPSYLKLTVETKDFQASGALMEISFGPEIGTTAVRCAVL